MTKEKLKIHSENILPIIKKWLYSDKDIFLRELVSNACDAISKLKVLQKDAPSTETEDFRIQILADKKAKTLKIIDNGIGMTGEEVQNYIAQIAFSGAEDFVKKYQSNKEVEHIIGHFGLGFYSAYMVAAKVEIDTLSYTEGAAAAFWSCDGSSEYLLEAGKKTSRGTEITLHIGQENEEYLDESKLSEILTRYCSFLPYPVYFGERLINAKEPLWIKAPSECSSNDYLEFYRHLYPMQEDPLFWIHLNVDYPFHLKGILYFPKLHRQFDMEKSSVKLYSNRVFVSETCKDIIPNYLIPLQGIIDSPDIPLNVSRSTLQMDKTVKQLSSHISKKVADNLLSLHRNEKARFLSIWEQVSFLIKLGIMEDEKFYEKIKDILLWKTAEGNWISAEEYLDKNKEKTEGKIFYAKDSAQCHSFLNIYQSKQIDVLLAGHPIDTHIIHFLERKLPSAKFMRIDSAVDDSILDKEKEKNILDASGKTASARLADLIRSKLDGKVEVEAKSLASESLPGFVMLNENERRMRDYLASVDPDQNSKALFPAKQTFVVNTNSPLMEAIEKIDRKNPTLAKEMCLQAYELALLSQREMDHSDLNRFINRTNHVLEQLAAHIN